MVRIKSSRYFLKEDDSAIHNISMPVQIEISSKIILYQILSLIYSVSFKIVKK